MILFVNNKDLSKFFYYEISPNFNCKSWLRSLDANIKVWRLISGSELSLYLSIFLKPFTHGIIMSNIL